MQLIQHGLYEPYPTIHTQLLTNVEELCTLYEEHLNEANAKLEEVTQLANDLKAQKTKLCSEHGK